MIFICVFLHKILQKVHNKILTYLLTLCKIKTTKSRKEMFVLALETVNKILDAEKYAKDNGFKNTHFFIDDGWSGVSFARPAFTEIMEMAEQGKIENLIVKDHSRLGRNRLIVG